MVSEKHITIEEAIALADGRYVLLPETEKHVAECTDCSSMISCCCGAKEIFAESKEFVPAVDEAKVTEIAAKSFANLPQDESDEALTLQTMTFAKSIALACKPFFAFSLGIALFIGIMLFQKADYVENT